MVIWWWFVVAIDHLQEIRNNQYRVARREKIQKEDHAPRLFAKLALDAEELQLLKRIVSVWV